MSVPYRIDGVITLLSPFHFATQEVRTLFSNKEAKFPGVAMTGIIAPDGTKGLVPIYSGNSARSFMRHLLSAQVISRIGGLTPVSQEAYYGLMHGGAETGLAEAPVELKQKARKHPLVGLFGGGPYMIKGSLRASNWIPVGPVTSHLVPQHYQIHAAKEVPEDEKAKWPEYRDTMFWTKTDSLMSGNVDLDLIEGGAQGVQEKIEAYASNKSAGTDERNPHRNTQNTEFVIPGTRMYLCYEAGPETGDVGAGVLLLGLQAFFQRQRLGGKEAIGFGKFGINAASDVRFYSPHSETSEPVFDYVPASINSLPSYKLNPVLEQRYIAPARAALEAFSKADIDYFFTVPAAKQRPKKASKGADAAAAA